jgi:pilus assembly protein TadC
VSFRTLKYLSFTHSAIYTALLILAISGAADGAKYALGWAHGIGWIVMSLVCIVAVRLHVISLRLAVAVAVLGGVGPFFGTAEFVREGRRRSEASSPATVQPQWP